jgi:hypothetical protein
MIPVAKWRLLLVFVGACLVAWLGYQWIATSRTSDNAGNAFEWRVALGGERPDEVQGEPLSTLSVPIELKNRSGRTIVQPRVGAGCSCRIQKPLPARILPGDKASFTISVTAPIAGSRVDPIAIREANAAEDLAVLPLRVTTRYSEPRLLHVPHNVDVDCLVGEAPTRTIAISTAERRDADYLLQLQVPTELGATVGAPTVQRTKSGEFDIVRRTYQVTFVSRESPGQFTTHLNCRLADGKTQRIPLRTGASTSVGGSGTSW